jgi:hypothetical protein
VQLLVAQALAQLHHHRMIALQVCAQIAQFAALLEQAMRQDFLARQHALAHAPAERFLFDLGDALEAGVALQSGCRIEAQQVVG